MAVTHWYTGEASTTTASVVVRADTTENVDIVVNGVTQTAACNTGVNDGNVKVTFTGLTPNTRYAYTINGTASGYVKTFPVSVTTDSPIWVAFTSCWSIQSVDGVAYKLLKAPPVGANATLWQEMVDNLAAFVGLGDEVYMNINTTVNGYSLSLVDGGTLANAKDTNVRRNYYRAARLSRGFSKLIQNVPTYFQKDDHEYDPDNASYDTGWLDLQFPATAPHTQTDLDDVWNAATTAWRDWHIGNPSRTLVSDYFKFTIANTEIFVPDLIQERDFIQDTDGVNKRMMSAEQEEQFLDDMAASTAEFKIWASTKQFISSCGRNADGWYNLPGSGSEGFQTQLTRILNDVRFPRKATLSITGDEHLKSDLFVDSDRFDTNHAAISQISAGPATIDVITDPEDGLAYTEGVRYKERDISELSERGENNYVLLRILPDKIERYVLGTRYGLRYSGYVSVNDNNVHY